MTDFSVPMPRSSLKRSQKPIRPRKKPQVKVGKLGIVRLSGKALEKLREECFFLASENCAECGTRLHFIAWFDGDPQAYDMAHIRSRGAGGSDVLDNIRALCHRCHMREHTKGSKCG